MFKNSKQSTELNKDDVLPAQHKSGPAYRWAFFSAKLVFLGLVIVGLVLLNPFFIKFVYSSHPPLAAANTIQVPDTQSVLQSSYVRIADPSLITISSLSLNAPFEPLGLQANHTIEVPKNNMGVGWFIYGAKPGAVGAFVVVGHLDSASGPAVFTNLNSIQLGDKIFITKTDGSVVVYKVDSLQKYSQNNFPTQAVYGPISYAGIRLITCSGVWDKKAGHYSQNLVVFGSETQ